MINEVSLAESKDLAGRLRFWLGDGFNSSEPGPMPDLVSRPGILGVIQESGLGVGALVGISETLRSFVSGVVIGDYSDIPYHKKTGAGGAICKFYLEWLDAFGNLTHSEAHFTAKDESAAVMATFRYVMAQQAAFPDVHNLLRRVRVRTVSFDVVSELGQIFYGDPNTFFQWDLSGECSFAEADNPLCFDDAVLLAATIYCQLEPWKLPVFA